LNNKDFYTNDFNRCYNRNQRKGNNMTNKGLIKSPIAQVMLCLLACGIQGSVLAERQVETEETVEYKTTTYAKKTPNISDSGIRREIDHIIDSHKELDDDVAFEVRESVITLRGHVDNNSERELAGRLAQEIEGVDKVLNVISVED
jgi:osmotically-inducible protein OsmY